MTNYLLSKGYRYYVRLSGNGQPILGSMIARRKAPRRGNGEWADVTTCLSGCCGVSLTAVDTTINIDTETGDILTLAGVTSSSGDTLSVTPINANGGDIVINDDGTFEITATATGVVLVVVVTDEHGNSITIFINVDVTVE